MADSEDCRLLVVAGCANSRRCCGIAWSPAAPAVADPPRLNMLILPRSRFWLSRMALSFWKMSPPDESDAEAPPEEAAEVAGKERPWTSWSRSRSPFCRMDEK